jgi:pimeloyl-ACP methyl ester carboxylesterase
MVQLVFIHGPGAGGCSAAYENQLKHFPGSVAPDLPGHLEGTRCPDVTRYADWVRGWLWAQEMKRDLVLVGYTLGGCIALQYALDYPDEVRGIVISTVAMEPKQRPPGTYDMRRRAAADPKVYEEEWIRWQWDAMEHVESGLRDRLMERHRQVGPISQMHDLMTIDAFDVRDRISTLQPKLLLLRGMIDHSNPPPYERRIHEAVPGSTYIELDDAGHFPPVDAPARVNGLIEDFIREL